MLTQNTRYRPEIDGLRAVAVISVIFFHANLTLLGIKPMQGGFLGVDVFFVISGYLITGIIKSEFDAGKFSFWGFYERRARRILPALLFVIAACWPAAWLLMTPEQLRNFSQSTISVLFFGSNFFFWLDTAYFSEGIHLKPLAHTWSLAVEEQFYLAFPFIALVIWRNKLRSEMMFLILSIASLATAQWMAARYPSANFYLFPTRAWELLAGVLLALLERKFGRPKPYGLVTPFASGAALAGLLISFAFFNENMRHPGLATLAPVSCTAALIWLCGGRDPTTRLLSSPPFVAIGLISYSLYLWHQPLFAFARIYSIDSVSQGALLGLAFMAVGLAAFSWRFVEMPFRRSSRIPARAFAATVAGAGILICTGGVAGQITRGFPARLLMFAALDSGIAEGYRTSAGRLCTAEDCIIGDTSRAPSIAVMGDSHAGVLARSFESALKEVDQSAIVLAKGDMLADHYPDFYLARDRYQPLLERHKKIIYDSLIKTVILSARYTLRIENTAFDNKEGGVETLRGLYGERSSSQKLEVLNAIDRGLRDLLETGKGVVLIYPIPEVGWDVPATLRKILTRGSGEKITTSQKIYRDRNARIIDLFDKIPDRDNLIRIRPESIFCNTFVKGRCATHSDSEVFYFDDDHLSVKGADLVVSEITKEARRRWGGLNYQAATEN